MSKFVQFFVGCFLLAVSLVAGAKAETVQVKDSIVFYPQEGKTLIAVGVVYNKRNTHERLVAFEQVLQAAGWQRQKSGDYYGIPGSCIINLQADFYSVDCYLKRRYNRHILRLQAKNAGEAVTQLKLFSGLLRVPPSERIQAKKIQTIRM
jgi:hypothetical protein